MNTTQGHRKLQDITAKSYLKTSAIFSELAAKPRRETNALSPERTARFPEKTTHPYSPRDHRQAHRHHRSIPPPAPAHLQDPNPPIAPFSSSAHAIRRPANQPIFSSNP
jgi:hypothetical protein